MECKLWEEKGLLYTSDELTDVDKEMYESHMADCSYCKDQYKFYTEAKNTIFKPECLEVKPSEELDIKIIKACSQKRSTGLFSMNLLSSFAKGGVIFTIALVIGLSVPLYFSKVQHESQVELSGIIEKTDTISTEKDSLKKDSINNDSPSNIVHSSSKGVIPVGLSSDE